MGSPNKKFENPCFNVPIKKKIHIRIKTNESGNAGLWKQQLVFESKPPASFQNLINFLIYQTL